MIEIRNRLHNFPKKKTNVKKRPDVSHYRL